LTTASPDEDLPDVVYLEHLTDARFLTKRGDVERYSGTAARLVFEAETPTRTPGILRVALHDPDEVDADSGPATRRRNPAQPAATAMTFDVRGGGDRLRTG
jgi:hypothetical protein